MHHHPPQAALLDVNLSDGTTFPLAASLQSMGIFYAFLPASDPADVPMGLKPFAFISKACVAQGRVGHGPPAVDRTVVSTHWDEQPVSVSAFVTGAALRVGYRPGAEQLLLLTK
jgi:hypothetical protein